MSENRMIIGFLAALLLIALTLHIDKKHREQSELEILRKENVRLKEDLQRVTDTRNRLYDYIDSLKK